MITDNFTIIASVQILTQEVEGLSNGKHPPSLCFNKLDSCRKAARRESNMLLLPLPRFSLAARKLQSCALPALHGNLSVSPSSMPASSSSPHSLLG